MLFELADLPLNVARTWISDRPAIADQIHSLLCRISHSNQNGRRHGHTAVSTSFTVDQHPLPVLDHGQGDVYPSRQGSDRNGQQEEIKRP
jgi:hypothetical protein